MTICMHIIRANAACGNTFKYPIRFYVECVCGHAVRHKRAWLVLARNQGDAEEGIMHRQNRSSAPVCNGTTSTCRTNQRIAFGLDLLIGLVNVPGHYCRADSIRNTSLTTFSDQAVDQHTALQRFDRWLGGVLCLRTCRS